MAATKQNKIDSLTTKIMAGEFRIEKFPSLSELTMGYGFKQGNQMFDEATERWRQNLERELNRIFNEQPKAELSTGNSG